MVSSLVIMVSSLVIWFLLLFTLSAHAREGYISQFVCLSTSDLKDDGVFSFETGINEATI